MGRLGPFERRPAVAVALSGGPDSLALCLLAERWAYARGGSLLALTIDHGLRPESRHEALVTGGWLAARGIRHEILPWAGAKPGAAIQAAAREARYVLLADRCRRERILHLLLGHHLDDQAETVALRLERSSGPDGAAGMAPVRELSGLRLLRPLLPIPKARLLATLEAWHQPWLEDPSNRMPTFARGRLRAQRSLDRERLAKLAGRCANERSRFDLEVAAWLVGAARIDPAGYVALEHGALRQAPAAIARRAILQALMTIGGRPYPPREERLQRLLHALLNERGCRGRTLAGCRILICRGDVLICREAGAIRHEIALPRRGVWQVWDRRFAVRLEGRVPDLRLRALGEAGWRARRRLAASGEARGFPVEVGQSLPAVWRGRDLVAVPHLRLRAPAWPERLRLEIRFQPSRPVAVAPFVCP